jgi:ubiquinone/menaquinone biosynthesis C-methylase UbiE
MPDTPPASSSPAPSYADEVREYYDESLADYLRVFGDTFQVALVRGRGGEEGSSAASNLALAMDAGIRPGNRVLDAGCGVCGPALDVARGFEGVTVDSVTLSPRQAETARQRIEEAGIGGRVRVTVGDYHALPFPDASFDVALFLESACYSYDPPGLFREVARVLRPGGRVLVKDVFRREGGFSPDVEAEFEEFNRLYHSRIGPAAAFVEAMGAAGLAEVSVEPLAARMSLVPYLGPVDSGSAFLPAPRGAVRRMTEMACIRARKPG